MSFLTETLLTVDGLVETLQLEVLVISKNRVIKRSRYVYTTGNSLSSLFPVYVDRFVLISSIISKFLNRVTELTACLSLIIVCGILLLLPFKWWFTSKWSRAPYESLGWVYIYRQEDGDHVTWSYPGCINTCSELGWATLKCCRRTISGQFLSSFFSIPLPWKTC